MIVVIIVAIALITLSGCSREGTSGERVGANSPPANAAVETEHAAADEAWHGTVLETMNSGGYTYVLVDTGPEQKWLAGPEAAIAVGDKVAVRPGMLMKDFTSKTLERTFEAIYFVRGIELDDGHTHD
jgi:hypothetical protein